MSNNMLSDEQKVECVREYARHTTGTENWHQHWTGRATYTDGVLYVAETCGAHWLVDLVISYQLHRRVRGAHFQVWCLEPRANPLSSRRAAEFVARCEDGDGNVLALQKIPYTDFPEELMPFRLLFENGVLLLSEER